MKSAIQTFFGFILCICSANIFYIQRDKISAVTKSSGTTINKNKIHKIISLHDVIGNFYLNVFDCLFIALWNCNCYIVIIQFWNSQTTEKNLFFFLETINSFHEKKTAEKDLNVCFILFIYWKSLSTIEWDWKKLSSLLRGMR